MCPQVLALVFSGQCACHSTKVRWHGQHLCFPSGSFPSGWAGRRLQSSQVLLVAFSCSLFLSRSGVCVFPVALPALHGGAAIWLAICLEKPASCAGSRRLPAVCFAMRMLACSVSLCTYVYNVYKRAGWPCALHKRPLQAITRGGRHCYRTQASHNRTALHDRTAGALAAG